MRIKQAAVDDIGSTAYDSEQRAARRQRPARVRGGDRERPVRHPDRGGRRQTGSINRDADRIDAIFVHPTHSRKGIATSLLRQLEARAQSHGIPELKTVSSLNAKPFYQAWNYWEFGTETRTIDGIDIEFVIMRKSLDIDGPR